MLLCSIYNPGRLSFSLQAQVWGCLIPTNAAPNPALRFAGQVLNFFINNIEKYARICYDLKSYEQNQLQEV